MFLITWKYIDVYWISDFVELLLVTDCKHVWKVENMEHVQFRTGFIFYTFSARVTATLNYHVYLYKFILFMLLAHSWK